MLQLRVVPRDGEYVAVIEKSDTPAEVGQTYLEPQPTRYLAIAVLLAFGFHRESGLTFFGH